MNGRILHTAEDGTVTDFTEAVQALYDLAVNSMDFGSGFWSYEDAVPVASLARTCGFEGVEAIDRYERAQRHRQEASAWQRTHRIDIYRGAGYDTAHAHAFSTTGQCMYPLCKVTGKR